MKVKEGKKETVKSPRAGGVKGSASGSLRGDIQIDHSYFCKMHPVRQNQEVCTDLQDARPI